MDMYDKETLESYASFANVMKLLKKNAQFNHFCTQHRMPAGTKLTLDKRRKICYLLETGYLKYSYSGSDGLRNFHTVWPGRFVTLPIIAEYVPNTAELLFLSDAVWWEIDFEYLRKMLLTEDPRNYIMLQFAIEYGYRAYILSTMRRISAEDRVLFALVRLARFGIRVGANRVELPHFLTYSNLAELTDTSKSYVTLALKDLRDKGILASSKKPWIVEDLAQLKGMVDIPDAPSY